MAVLQQIGALVRRPLTDGDLGTGFAAAGGAEVKKATIAFRI